MAKILYILMGSSQSGKSTTTRKLIQRAKAEGARAEAFSADDYFQVGGEAGRYAFDPSKLGEAHGQCLRRTAQALWATLASSHIVVVDNTNTTIAEIAPYIALGQAYGYDVRVIPHRGNRGDNGHGVPEHARNAQALRMEETLAQWPPFWPAPHESY
jgi:predicted kinase